MANRDTSSSCQPQHGIEEEETAVSYRSQISPRTSSKNDIVIERFHSYGIPLKPGGKLPAITTIQ
jgi:hypothetical protein